MITKQEAYEIIRGEADFPVTYMLETPNCYLSTSEKYLSVNKKTAIIDEYTNYANFLTLAIEGKYCFMSQIFEDYLAYYKAHPGDEYLAVLYAGSANRLFYHSHENPAMYSTELDQCKFCDEWGKIEQLLFFDISERIKSEKTSCLPRVYNNPDDPYYIVKPFMLRNGWTTNDINRAWVKLRT